VAIMAETSECSVRATPIAETSEWRKSCDNRPGERMRAKGSIAETSECQRRASTAAEKNARQKACEEVAVIAEKSGRS
jgi:hypothetical protein